MSPLARRVTASDPGDTLAYSLEGPDASSFRIVRASGQIETRSGVAYDFEARGAYAVTVKATDSHNTSVTIAVDIDITDVDRAPGRTFPAHGVKRINHQPVGELEPAFQQQGPSAHN